MITQIDSGNGGTWATGSTDNHTAIYALQNDGWINIGGSLTHVTVGKSGVWGVNWNNDIYFREGVTSSKPDGIGWKHLSGELIQIDAGSFGIVYGVNRCVFISSFLPFVSNSYFACTVGRGGLRLSAMFSRECEFDPITSLVEEIFNDMRIIQRLFKSSWSNYWSE